MDFLVSSTEGSIPYPLNSTQDTHNIQHLASTLDLETTATWGD